ncbi:hypothetical protein N6H18_01520 [Reichenbachiella agarivorans]|uniref:DUF6249 domain-containing protein n=1 Tax=Reichenbachiella agarivorans TaxID=2979464 RepID=A0ABY6CQ51_9BACT|nr:DUF6249 domain-containing protein [Reichenbachiella agarivorans]UXP32647.1 hypothetical protein N6H18_01520 [Reichenbachiella agarivorans]
MDAEIIIPVVLFTSTAAVLIVIRKFMNDERLALIEKGGDANIFNRKAITFPAVKIGLLLIGAGIGILVGNMISVAGLVSEEVGIFSCLMIFGGLGLFISYFVEEKFRNKEENK